MKSMGGKAPVLSVCIAGILATIFFSGCSSRTQSAQSPVISVTAGKAEVRAMPVQVESVGNVVAYNSAIILSQVTGRVQQLHFQEGQEVKTGDLLITIDPAPFTQKLAQAQALLAHDSDQATFAAASAKRYDTLFSKGAVSRQDYEQSASSARAQAATVQQTQAAVENARIDLNNCYIRSPIDGRTGAFLANLGALATTNATQLLVVNQVEPIFVSFTVQEKDLRNILAAQNKGPLKVVASVTDQNIQVDDGQLTFVDNTVNASAGVIQLKARFPNQRKELWPGQFVRVTLLLDTQPNAVIVPAEAVNMGPTGRYIFVIKDDMTVEARTVEQSRLVGNLAVIDKGLNAGELVVTDGQVNLRTGTKVSIKENLTPAKTSKTGEQGGGSK
ncbi:MAG TPA: efflux RND transporter periplasmic adaptor subunit [Negativicutes bacterium]|nr:efflux RND transporter periplasmic adaptor subunit [Negativicutes bacterium]